MAPRIGVPCTSVSIRRAYSLKMLIRPYIAPKLEDWELSPLAAFATVSAVQHLQLVRPVAPLWPKPMNVQFLECYVW